VTINPVDDVFAYMEKYRRVVDVLRRLEWAGSTPAQYFGAARSCPACRGIDPSDKESSGFIREAHGHRIGCPIAREIAEVTP
jgi:hypothetical protein